MAPHGLYLTLLLGCMAPLCASKAVRAVSATSSPASQPPLPTPTGTQPFCADASPSIPNGDFESGALGPWGTRFGERSNGSISVVEGGHNSAYAAQMAGNWFMALTQYYMPNCEATNYSITFDYKVIDASADCQIVVQETRQQYSRSGSFHIPPVAAADWASGSLAFGEYTADTFGIQVVVNCDEGGGATLLLDNFAIATLASLEPQGCPLPVAIPNGGFETGSLAPWKVFSPEVTPPLQSFASPGYNGSSTAVKLAFPAVGQQSSWQISTNVAGLCLAYDYVFSLAINWGNYTYPDTIWSKGDGCFMTAYAASCTGKVPSLYLPAPPNSGWQQISFPCRPKSSEDTMFQFEVQCLIVDKDPVPAFTMQVDSFSVALA